MKEAHTKTESIVESPTLGVFGFTFSPNSTSRRIVGAFGMGHGSTFRTSPRRILGLGAVLSRSTARASSNPL